MSKYLDKNGLSHLKDVIFNLLSSKLDKNLGSSNSNKFLSISNSGSVIPTELTSPVIIIKYDDNLNALSVNADNINLIPNSNKATLGEAILGIAILG